MKGGGVICKCTHCRHYPIQRHRQMEGQRDRPTYTQRYFPGLSGRFWLAVLTISSLWSSRFLRNKENSCKDSSGEKKEKNNLSLSLTHLNNPQHRQGQTKPTLAFLVIKDPDTCFHGDEWQSWKPTLTDTFLIIRLCVANVLKLKLSETVGKLALCHAKLWKQADRRGRQCLMSMQYSIFSYAKDHYVGNSILFTYDSPQKVGLYIYI